MKLKLLIIGLILTLALNMPAMATQLPQDFRNYIIKQKKIPTIRHDGVLVYGKDVMYIPILPAYPEKVDKISIVKTYPANKDITAFPDIIVFNNNFSLLKVIKTGENVQSVLNLEEYPVEVKTGELPQDLMVPHGFVLPENLAAIAGDVYIPLVGSAKTPSFVTGKKAPLPMGKRIVETKKYSVPENLKSKLFFVNNYQDEYLKVFSSTVSEPLYSLKTSGVMRDVKPVLGGKYLLAATKDKKNIDVIDVNGEYIFKQIDLTANPSEIVVDDKNFRAYVSSVEDECLFIIDTKTLKVVEKIQLAGAPKRLAVSPDGNKIAYMDIKTSNIFILELDNDYANKLITNYPNTSKLLFDEYTMYVIARTEPKLRIISFNLLSDNITAKTKKDKKKDKIKQKELQAEANDNVGSDLFSGMEVPEKENSELKSYATSIKDIKSGEKPIDMYKYGTDLFVLCAGDNTVYKYDIKSGEITTIPLSVKGFAKTFSVIPQTGLAVITNMADYNYAVFDMEQGKELQTVPVSEFINSITILERTNEQ